MSEWYDPNTTKRGLTCILEGCKPCSSRLYCNSHDKPCSENAPGIPSHCKDCGEFIYDLKRDTKGMF